MNIVLKGIRITRIVFCLICKSNPVSFSPRQMLTCSWFHICIGAGFKDINICGIVVVGLVAYYLA